MLTYSFCFSYFAIWLPAYDSGDDSSPIDKCPAGDSYEGGAFGSGDDSSPMDGSGFDFCSFEAVI